VLVAFKRMDGGVACRADAHRQVSELTRGFGGNVLAVRSADIHRHAHLRVAGPAITINVKTGRRIKAKRQAAGEARRNVYLGIDREEAVKPAPAANGKFITSLVIVKLSVYSKSLLAGTSADVAVIAPPEGSASVFFMSLSRAEALDGFSFWICVKTDWKSPM